MIWAISCAITAAISDVVVGERQQAAGHENVARRQREGVDDRRIQDGHPVDLGRRLGGRGEARQNAVEITLGGRRAVFAAEEFDEAFALAAGQRAAGGARRGAGRETRRLRAGRLDAGAGGGQQREADEPDARQTRQGAAGKRL